jgi:2-(1,2-epoxy-1,2-dihydrophenyl)acetyl-CoA isomerase
MARHADWSAQIQAIGMQLASARREDSMAAELPASLALEMIGTVAKVTFSRPDRRNAIDFDTCIALRQLLVDLDRDRGVRAILIAGTDRDFCTGADVSASPDAVAKMKTMDYRFATTDYQALFQQMWETETPMVSAVTGTVAGAGWMLALLADLVVANAEAKWTHVFTRRGMVPHAGDPYFLPRIIPFHRLNEIALLSDPIPSTTLHEWGLVNRCVAPDQVLPVAMELAGRLAEGPTRALAMTKRLYRRSPDQDINAAFEAERNAQALISTTADRREGVQSLIERRPAAFIGD